MVRKQVYIEAHQERLLKHRAKTLGVTEADLIRRSLEHSLALSNPSRPDPTAWEKIERLIRSRQRSRIRPAPRRWTREELYEPERPGR